MRINKSSVSPLCSAAECHEWRLLLFCRNVHFWSQKKGSSPSVVLHNDLFAVLLFVGREVYFLYLSQLFFPCKRWILVETNCGFQGVGPSKETGSTSSSPPSHTSENTRNRSDSCYVKRTKTPCATAQLFSVTAVLWKKEKKKIQKMRGENLCALLDLPTAEVRTIPEELSCGSQCLFPFNFFTSLSAEKARKHFTFTDA